MLYIIFAFCRGVSGLVYYGISLSTPSVGGNMYLNFFISAVCEGIGMMIGIFLLDKYAIMVQAIIISNIMV